MSKRLNVLVENCGECPHVSQVITSAPIGSIWMCSFKRRVVSKEGRLPATIPSWCPLPDDVPEAKPWCPSECPITGLPFFMWLHHDDMGWVPTYGGPFDSYTIPERDDMETLHDIKCHRVMRLRYDHDAGSWMDWEVIDSIIVSDQALMKVLPDDVPLQVAAHVTHMELVPVKEQPQ